jgi:hypothetical protein
MRKGRDKAWQLRMDAFVDGLEIDKIVRIPKSEFSISATSIRDRCWCRGFLVKIGINKEKNELIIHRLK